MDATLMWTIVGSLAAVASVAVAIRQLRQGQSAPDVLAPISTVRDALRDVATRWYWRVAFRAFGAECSSSCVFVLRDSSDLWEQVLRTREGTDLEQSKNRGVASPSSDPDSRTSDS